MYYYETIITFYLIVTVTLMYEPPQEHPEAHNVRVRDTLLCIAKACYFIHHFLICLYSLMLLILEPLLRERFTASLVLIIIYGFLVLWILLFNLAAVGLNHDKWAVWCNRLVAKIFLMTFPLFLLIAYINDQFLHLRSVTTFMIYQLSVSVCMIIYQVYSCSWGHHEEPSFLYHPNDLKNHYQSVWEKRKEFMALKKQRSVQSA